MSDDGYTRITLRIPDSLHGRLTAEAARTSKSMNAEIIARLEASFEPTGSSNTLVLNVESSADLRMDDLMKYVRHMQKETGHYFDSIHVSLVPPKR